MGLARSREIYVKLQRVRGHREGDYSAGIQEFGSFSDGEDGLIADNLEKLAVAVPFGFADKEKLAGAGFLRIMNPANFIIVMTAKRPTIHQLGEGDAKGIIADDEDQ